MSITLATLVTKTRTLLREPVAGFFTDAQIEQWLIEAQDLFTYRTECLRAIDSFATVAEVRDYALPARVISFDKIAAIYYDQDRKLQYIDEPQWYSLTAYQPYMSGDPEYYTLQDGRLHVWPVPNSTNSAATTTLSAAIVGAGDTTATVVSNAVFPFNTGRVVIGSEVIEFRGRSGTASLLNLRRGLEDTTAVAHLLGATVTEQDIWVHHIRRPAVMSATIGTEIPDAYGYLLVNYAAAQGWAKRADQNMSRHWLTVWEAGLANAQNELLYPNSIRDRYPQILPYDAMPFGYYGRV